MDNESKNLISNFYLTSNFECSYLSNRQARSVVAMPLVRLAPTEFGNLITQGFRRSGYYIYRPQCNNCKACIPVRLRVSDFVANRSQKRNINKFENLHTEIKPLEFEQEHYELYKAYQDSRHHNSKMAEDTPEQYRQFFLESLVESKIIEFRDQQGKLKIVSLIDFIDDGISAVYSFFDNTLEKSNSGLGIYAIMWQVELVKKLDLNYLYLGYWIGASEKMNYKAKFQPLEKFDGRKWHNW